MFEKSTCIIDWLLWILSISRLSFKHVIKYFVALGIPSKRRQLPEEQNKTGKRSQIQGTAPTALPQTHHLSPATWSIIHCLALLQTRLSSDTCCEGIAVLIKPWLIQTWWRSWSSFYCLPARFHEVSFIFLFKTCTPPHLLSIPVSGAPSPAPLLWTPGTFFALNMPTIRNAVFKLNVSSRQWKEVPWKIT